MRTDDIRKAYLEFFRSKGHEVVPSDSLVPKDDPSLLFTGAGMNQFKEKFLGRNVTYRRATSSQKCLRTGDLENVGRTAGHHTFFEMLGNFSFGDYFKKEAIVWAWEFLTTVLKIDPGLLWVSVYKDDEEAYALWRDVVKIPQTKIVRLGEKENFWPSEAPTKGPNGPCGPCSEIFYDRGEEAGCGKSGCSPACDCARFIEIWNLVFTQFDRQSDGSLKSLPSKNIDTGMGLERISSVMQGVRTNFEINIFTPITAAIEKTVDRRPQTADRRPKVNAIADHVRAVAFTISDGVMPSNEERGYVVRKLIRRSVTYAHDLGIQGPFLYKLVSVVADVMGGAYPELRERRDDIAQVVKHEEESFSFVITSQLPRVEEVFADIAQKKAPERLPEAAFNFYDTYGMPYDMLEEVAEKFGLKIEKAAFKSLLERQRAQSRSKSKIKSEIFTETFAKKVEALGLRTDFLGHEESRAEAKVMAVLEGGEVILDRTPFYGESGGQAGDWGIIETPSGTMKVEDAKKFGETIVHIGTMVSGAIKRGEKAKVSIDEVVRRDTMKNHTATHLLQAALRKVLGEHVRQTGSLVDSEHLRFDFTHMKKMEPREVERVEEIVNEAVKRGLAVKKDIKDIEEAKRDGAMALFGEKYEKRVRVVTIGDISKELCGGTHLDNTRDIEVFKITSESSIASGVRRIEAVTGVKVVEWMKNRKDLEAQRLRAQAQKEAEKRDLEQKLKGELEKVGNLIAKARDIHGVKFIGEVIADANMEILRALADAIKSRERSTAIVLAAKTGGKIAFVTSVTDDIVKDGIVNANDLAKALAQEVGGSGGGRADFAQGGGKDTSKLEGALEKMYEIVKGRVR